MLEINRARPHLLEVAFLDKEITLDRKVKLEYLMLPQEHYSTSSILCHFKRDLLTCQSMVRKENFPSYYVQTESIERLGFFSIYFYSSVNSFRTRQRSHTSQAVSGRSM